MTQVLLIVPYGIETSHQIWQTSLRYLLIVPYGIETHRTWRHIKNLCAFNRTLWNWNVEVVLHLLFSSSLLIVPYGIETGQSAVRNAVKFLLIVPYGIETQCVDRLTAGRILLIVPYGIETEESENLVKIRRVLLIVPYGIETNVYLLSTFNRTLWNWNIYQKYLVGM